MIVPKSKIRYDICIRMCLMWANVRGVYFVFTQYIYIHTHTYCWSKKNTSANSSNVQNLIVKYPTNPMIWCMNHFFPLTVSYIDHACLRTGFFFKNLHSTCRDLMAYTKATEHCGSTEFQCDASGACLYHVGRSRFSTFGLRWPWVEPTTKNVTKFEPPRLVANSKGKFQKKCREI